MVTVRKLIQEALRSKELCGRFHRCKVAPRLSGAIYAHVEERRRSSRFHFRGKPFKTWVDLDPVLMVNELQEFLSNIEVSTYLLATLGDDVCCVTAELLLTSSAKAPQQKKHRDHKFGYGKFVYLVFDIDGHLVDTLIDEDGTLCPANCPALLFDAFAYHAGPAGNRQSKILLGFSNPRLPCFRRMLRQQRPAAFTKRLEWPRLSAWRTRSCSSALVIKREWGEQILSGEKTLEIRRGACSSHKGERIALCYSGTGCVYGFVDLVDSIGPFTLQEWGELRDRHRVPEVSLPYGKHTCGWVLANPQRLETPIEIVRSRGAVIWQVVNL